MRQKILRNLVVITLFAGCIPFAGCKAPLTSKSDYASNLTVEELLKNPQRYAHSMVRVHGCFVVGLESTTLRPCEGDRFKDAIWVEDARLDQAMRRHRLPGLPNATPPGLERPIVQKELFAYDEGRNKEAWKKLNESERRGQVVVEVVLLGQFETAGEQTLPGARGGFGHLGAYSHELILDDVVSIKAGPQEAETRGDQVIETTVCEVVEDPLRFIGKEVRFSARFESDGIERSVLTDSRCVRGIEPLIPDDIEQHPDVEAFNHALDHGMRSTLDKRIVANFAGRFAVRDANGRLRYALNIERIDALEITRIDLTPHVRR